MTSRADRIACAVLDQFETLPPKRKPAVRDNGLHEWVPLAGIVADFEGQMTCLALATGTKCLPSSRLLESKGVGIHDWHAEILAIRVFNRFLLGDCQRLLEDGAVSRIIRKCDRQDAATPFQIRDGIKLHMYCSAAPCGDASMELTMAAQDDASPWDSPTIEAVTGAQDSLPGRANFSQLGIVRRKPARADAITTLSKSCSDKLALKQGTSLLSSLTSLFIDPRNAYIDTLVLPESQYSVVACRRAFSEYGRMQPLANVSLPGTYSFTPFSVETTDLEFRYSKRSVQARSEKILASNLAAAWSISGLEESMIGGVLQGRKPFVNKGASRTSRQHMWKLAKKLADQLHEAALEIQLHTGASTYGDIKAGPLLADRRQVKAEICKKALVGWFKNEGDSDFGIDDLVQGQC